MRIKRVTDLFRVIPRRSARAPDALADASFALVNESKLFDRDFYLTKYPDVAGAGVDPLRHYLDFGWSEGRNPGPRFDTNHYLASNPDVAGSGMNPLLHFIAFGAKEGRSPLPESASRVADEGDVGVGEGEGARRISRIDLVERAIADSGCFDEAFYRNQAEGMLGAGDNAVRHYILSGAMAEANPAEWFDTAFYLQTNRDVERSGVNPFYHFLEYGWKELRSPSHDVDAVWLLLFNEELRTGRTGIPSFLRERWRGRDFQLRRFRGYSPNDKAALVGAISSMVDSGGANPCALHRLGQTAEYVGAPLLAREVYAAAMACEPESLRCLRALSMVNRSLGDWQAYLECVQRLLDRSPSSASLLRDAGIACQRLGHLGEASAFLERSLGIERDEEAAYRLGLVREALGDEKGASVAYTTALRLSKLRADEISLGPGVLHQARGDYARALAAFKRRLAKEPSDPHLHARLGCCHERLYQWECAEDAYRTAARLDAGYGRASWHYRIGFVNERMGRLASAALSYRAAISLSSEPVPDWEYRLGYVLDSMGECQAACRAYLGRIGVSPPGAQVEDASAPVISPPDSSFYQDDDQLADYLAQFGDVSLAKDAPAECQPSRLSPVSTLLAAASEQERAGQWQEAGRSYEKAAARDDEQDPQIYRSAGRAYLYAGLPADAVRVLRHSRHLCRPYVASLAPDKITDEGRRGAIYLEYMGDLPLNEKVIMYESFSGLSMACNPLAIFKHLIAMPAFSDFTHVWVINDRSRVPSEFMGRSDVVFISRDSNAYVRFLATAKYLINNSGFPAYFIRRPGQQYLATWHGTPLKTLGKDQKYKFYDHKRTQRNFLHATHIISPNAHTTSVLLDSYEIRSFYSGVFAETGYPRIDLTLSAGTEARRRLRERLSLDDGRKVVLYAPTWRGTPDEVWFDFGKVQSDLEQLARLDCQVLFRGHSWLERAINAAHVECDIVPADIDTNELLSIVDVLVTDYSSVFFDFFATGRPVIYYIYDLEDYTRDRGLYFEMDALPGVKCRNIGELVEAVGHALAIDVGQDPYSKEFNPHDDGQATRRVVELFFEGGTAGAIAFSPPPRKRVLFYAGSFARGRQSELAIALANSLDRDRYEVIFVFTPWAVEITAGGVDRFKTLRSDVRVLPRYGKVVMTPDERVLRSAYESGRLPAGSEAAGLVRDVYDREIYRLMCDLDVHAIVAFEGNDNFWPKLLFDNRLQCKKIRISDGGVWSGFGDGVIDVAYEDVLLAGVSSLVPLLDN